MVQVVEKGTPITTVTSIPETMRDASPTTLVEEITPRPKRQQIANKGKGKWVPSRQASGTTLVWP